MSAIIDKIHRAYDLPKYVWLDDETGVEKYWVDENEILHIKFVAYNKVVQLPVGGNEEILCEDDHGIPCVYDEEEGWIPLCDSCVECGYFADECYCIECEEEEKPVPSVPRAIITGIDGVEYEIKIKRSRK